MMEQMLIFRLHYDNFLRTIPIDGLAMEVQFRGPQGHQIEPYLISSYGNTKKSRISKSCGIIRRFNCQSYSVAAGEM